VREWRRQGSSREPSTNTVTITTPTASRSASPQPEKLAFRIEERPPEPQMTMLGTMVSSASALVQNRSVPRGQ
jgi:hypothetical protein